MFHKRYYESAKPTQKKEKNKITHCAGLADANYVKKILPRSDSRKKK